MNETNIKKLVREAGTVLMNLLFNKATKPSGPSRNVSVHYKDIAHLSQQYQQDWKKACPFHLNSLLICSPKNLTIMVDLILWPLSMKAACGICICLHVQKG